MRVDLCSAETAATTRARIDTFTVETVADLDSRVIYVVHSEVGFNGPLPIHSPSGKCWKDFPPSDIARDVYSIHVVTL